MRTAGGVGTAAEGFGDDGQVARVLGRGGATEGPVLSIKIGEG